MLLPYLIQSDGILNNKGKLGNDVLLEKLFDPRTAGSILKCHR